MSMSYKGFRIYSGYRPEDYMPASYPDGKKKTDVRGKDDDMLDIIFCRDPLTNLPAGSLSMYLSDKTNEQVRKWIEDNLLRENPESVMSVPSNLRDELLKLDSDFIAKVSRNRFEDKESYEKRVQSYFDEIEQDKAYQKKVKELRAKLKHFDENKS